MAGEESGVVKSFSCPGCGAPIDIKVAGQSITCVCSACAAVVDASDRNHKIVSRQTELNPPLIALGSRGRLRGDSFELIGHMRRSDDSGLYRWEEYLLWNPQIGFRWLSHADGHWTFFVPIKTQPEMSGSQAIAAHRGKSYYLFQRGYARVNQVLGEFYWRVKVGDRNHTVDYIAPPEMLSSERSDNEVVWSLGEYLDADAIQSAFGLSSPLPPRKGVAPNQPAPLDGAHQAIWLRAAAFASALVIIALLIPYGGQSAMLLDTNFQNTKPPQTFRSRAFDVINSNGNVAVEVDALATFDNSWAEVVVTLVDDANASARTAKTEISYYSGQDFDGAWSEGSRESRVMFSGVPAGRYHVEVDVDSPIAESTFEVRVRRGVFAVSNFVIALLGILAFPIGTWFRQRSFELNRWSQSDFSPFAQHQEE